MPVHKCIGNYITDNAVLLVILYIVCIGTPNNDDSKHATSN